MTARETELRIYGNLILVIKKGIMFNMRFYVFLYIHMKTANFQVKFIEYDVRVWQNHKNAIVELSIILVCFRLLLYLEKKMI